MLQLLFLLPLYVDLEIGQIHKKTIAKQHGKGESEVHVQELCDPS